ncbi:Uncharacterised protein [Mycobacteroides abscessus subsp. abscessus]|nr:Uncharacterised protein [Mycobacteroides abscessus subsp. abscessus]
MSAMIAVRVVALMLMVPGNAACSCEQPNVTGGSGKTLWWSLMAVVMAQAMRVSVPRGRCGPCCSNAPTGSTATVLAVAGSVVVRSGMMSRLTTRLLG